MNADEPARVKTGVEKDGGQGPGDEPGLRPAGERRLPWRSVVVLRDLGMSHERIVAYSCRFPTPLPPELRCWPRPPASTVAARSSDIPSV